MALTILEAEVAVTADGTKVPGKVADDVDRNSDGPMSRAGLGMAGKLFAGFMAYKGTEAAIGWIGGAISGGSDLNETINKSTTIFGENAGAIERWADNAAINVGMAKGEALAAAAGFGDMFLQLGFTGSAAADMSKSVVQAAADLGSFSNLETADVTERISAAFRGEYDSLQAVIPNINAARVETEAMAASGKTAASELTAQEKAAAVLAIVQKDGARAMGDFARTSDDYANSSKIATAQLADLQAEVGTALLPTMTDLMTLVRDQVIPVFQGAAQWFGDNIDLIKGVGMAVGVAAGTFLVLNGAVSVYNGIMGVYRAITTAGSVAQWALNAAMNANPIGIVIGLISLLVGAIVWVATQTTFFQDAWAVMCDVIGTAWDWLWNSVLSPVFTAIGTAATWLVDNVFVPVGSFISTVVTGIGEVFTWLYNNIIMPVVTGIMLYIGLWAGIIVWLWENVAGPIFGLIGQAFQWLGDNVFGPVGSFIGDVFRNIGSGFSWLYTSVIQPVGAAIGAAFSWVYNSIIAPIGAGIRGAINAVGAVFSWLYNNAVRPAFDGIAGAINWVWGSIISPVFNAISGAVRAVGDTFRNIFGGIGGFIQSAFSGALNAVRGPVNGIIGLVNSAIRGLNSLSVTIPDWVPVVGGQRWGLNLGTIPMLAEGGITRTGGTVLVGERGPEFLTLPAGAQVTPLDRRTEVPMPAPTGGGDMHVDIEINEADDPLGSAGRVAAELRKFRRR
jgi:hypothetical protein